MVTYLVLVKDFNVFIWMNLDRNHNHGYHDNVSIYIWYNIGSGNWTINEWKCSKVNQSTYLYTYFIYGCSITIIEGSLNPAVVKIVLNYIGSPGYRQNYTSRKGPLNFKTVLVLPYLNPSLIFTFPLLPFRLCPKWG